MQPTALQPCGTDAHWGLPGVCILTRHHLRPWGDNPSVARCPGGQKVPEQERHRSLGWQQLWPTANSGPKACIGGNE